MLLLLLKSMAKVSLALEDTHPIVFSHSDPKTQSALEGSQPGLAWAKLEMERHFNHPRTIHRFWQSCYFAALAVAVLYRQKQFASLEISAGKS